MQINFKSKEMISLEGGSRSRNWLAFCPRFIQGWILVQPRWIYSRKIQKSIHPRGKAMFLFNVNSWTPDREKWENFSRLREYLIRMNNQDEGVTTSFRSNLQRGQIFLSYFIRGIFGQFHNRFATRPFF